MPPGSFRQKPGSSEEVAAAVSASTLTRWSGMAALLGGVLFVIAILVSLLLPLVFFDPNEPPSQGTISFVYILRSFLALSGEALLVLGLVGLYVRQSESTGVVGLISFLVTFFGLVLTLAGVPWSDLPLTLGWALFGVTTLKARIFPRPAAILLLIGAVATGVVSALLGGGLAGVGGYVGIGATIVLNAAIGWLGFNLFTGRGVSTAAQPKAKEESQI
jgi:hypothetical protein